MAQHPNSLANLKPPWKPGESGNPKGRASYRETFEHIVQQLANEVHEDERTNLEALARKAWDLAIAGDDKLLPVVLDRVWPKVSRHEVGFVEHPEQAELADSLASLARRRRTNGSGQSVDPEAAEDASS